MRTLRQIDIKNCPGYFFNSMINIMDLDTNLLIINQISSTSTDIVFMKLKILKILTA